MIKFFRHIRKSLLMEGKTDTSSKASAKTSKYFKYAIGEIVLVVIGILIALQINNWNEARKLEKSKNQLMLALKNELVKNKSELENYNLELHESNSKFILFECCRSLIFFCISRFLFLPNLVLIIYPIVSLLQYKKCVDQQSLLYCLFQPNTALLYNLCDKTYYFRDLVHDNRLRIVLLL